ncbi:MAG: hypothetical protein GY899_11225 [Verrucomicrobiaceae bacterium]|nr:hypothetical protein [Verrucomicrobiaceae bacterium]
MDLLALRNSLASELVSYLGTYTLGNGSTTPAIIVRDPGEGVTAGTSVSGLEVVLVSVPELIQELQYTDSPFVQNWTVNLIDWGGGSIEQATALVQSGYPGTTAQIVSVVEDKGPRRQTQLSIPLSRDGGQDAFQIAPTAQVLSVNTAVGHVSLGLGDLADVDASSVADEAVLVYNAASSKYKLDEVKKDLTDGGNF